MALSNTNAEYHRDQCQPAGRTRQMDGRLLAAYISTVSGSFYLLQRGYVPGNILYRWRILECQSVALALNTSMVNQNTGICVQSYVEHWINL